MSIHNFKKYKESKVLLPDIELLLQVFKLVQMGLKKYSHDIPVYKVSRVLSDQILVLESYKRELNDIKKNKGKTN